MEGTVGGERKNGREDETKCMKELDQINYLIN